MLEWNKEASVAVCDVSVCLFGLEMFTFHATVELAIRSKVPFPFGSLRLF